MGTSRLKITPTFPQPKKSPLKLLGFFLFLPPLHSLKTLHSELGRKELQRQQAEGSNREGGWEGGEKNRVDEWKNKKNQVAWLLKLHSMSYVIPPPPNLSSSPPVTSFQLSIHSQSAVRRHQSRSNQGRQLEMHHLDMIVIQLIKKTVNHFYF